MPSSNATQQESTSTRVPGQYPSPPSSPIIASQRSLARAIHERRKDFIKPESVRIKIGTWNVAALPGTENDLQAWFVQGKGVDQSLARLNLNDQNAQKSSKGAPEGTTESVEHQEARRTSEEATVPKSDHGALPADGDVGLYVLGLQEIVDISSPAEALRPYNDPAPSAKWKRAAYAAVPEGYALLAEQQLSGLLLLIFASPAIYRSTTSVSSTMVGTGILGYMGNKGAVVTRIVIGGTTRLVFICSHLAAGADRASLDRRNWDAGQILTRTRFGPVEGDLDADGKNESIGDEDAAFWFGDLNYRLDGIPGDDVRRLLLRHTREAYAETQTSLKKINKELELPLDSVPEHEPPQQEASTSSKLASGLKAMASTITPSSDKEDTSPGDDPASLQTTLTSLLPHDQLHEQMHRHRAFHEGWQEGPVKFLPTYKYDVGSVGMFDSSEKQRSPSWCDRILYRTRKEHEAYSEKKKTGEASRARDQQMKERGLGGDDVLFDYDPETDGADEHFNEYDSNDDAPGNTQTVSTKQSSGDQLQLEYYISHQRVLSSDHKPITAVFKLIYQAEDPDLKSKISAEVAKELDKAENEARPGVTVDVDGGKHAEDTDNSIGFGEVHFATTKSRTITIANTSQVRANFEFVYSGGGLSHSWLQVKPDDPNSSDAGPLPVQKYALDPGDTIQMQILIQVTAIEDARQLNAGRVHLEDVLVLRVHEGRDHFLPVRARWLRTSFGMSLDKLSRTNASDMGHQQGESGHGDEVGRFSAPRQLSRLAEALEALLERAIAEWGMKGETGMPPWDVSGWPFADDSWKSTGETRDEAGRMTRESLDQGTSFEYPPNLESYEKVEVLAEMIVRFVDAIEDGIIGGAVWSKLTCALHEQEKLYHDMPFDEKRALVLENLSAFPANSAAFTYVVFTLARIANDTAPLRSASSPPATPRTADGLLRRARGLSDDPVVTKRKEVERIYASIFAQAMIKAALPPKVKDQKKDKEHRREVIQVFLQHEHGS